ncbi:MAG: hypothetical protein CV090_13475 [Nitrospira sp. WS238]|nr:hypothetical protein [Nitrospira sp. WS238]
MRKTLHGMPHIRAGIFSLMLGLVLISPSTGPAMAMELNFNIVAPTTGSISYDGIGGGLIGTTIDVDNVVGLSTPLNNNVTSTCLTCVLNFTSGLNSSAGGGTWQFGSGGSISITGGVDFLVGSDIPVGSTLLTGTFSSAEVKTLGGVFEVTFGSFTDVKHADLLSYYGMPSGNYDGSLTILFDAATGPGDAFISASLFGGSIANVAAVPLPAAAWLFGSGLLGLYSVVRRRRAI